MPRKNIRRLCGRPLIAYSIAAAKASKAVTATYVSTEDSEISAIASSLGVPVIPRPQDLAGDGTKTNAVIEHALTFLTERGERFTHVLLLQPTSPLRTALHVTESLRLFSQSNARSLISVCIAEHHPFKDFRIARDRLEPLFTADVLDQPRQVLEPVYRQNGAIYIAGVTDFLARHSFYLPPCLPFVMSHEDSLDIDNQIDFDLAATILNRRSD